jgi:hypothetical protein
MTRLDFANICSCDCDMRVELLLVLKDPPASLTVDSLLVASVNMLPVCGQDKLCENEWDIVGLLYSRYRLPV